jgi:hypothetical protein
MIASHACGLSPWKGGGFGMFASIDQPGNRFLVIRATDIAGHVYSVRVDQDNPPLYGPLSPRALVRAVALPSEPTLLSIAEAVLSGPVAPRDELGLRLPARLRLSNYEAALLRFQELPSAELVSRSESTTRGVHVNSVHVRVVTMKFDAHNYRVTIKQLAEATALTERAAATQ